MKTGIERESPSSLLAEAGQPVPALLSELG